MGENENLKQTLNTPEIQENLDEIQMGFADNRRRSLCLRENPKPKKSWLVSSNPIMEHGSSFCEQCGKGFKSDKALFGHMRLHSKRKSVSVKKIVDFPKPLKKKRSERRYNKINSCSYNSNPCSSSSMTVNFDCVDQELEEIAVCLLMLGNGGFCSFYAPVDKPFSDDEDCSVKLDPSFAIESAQISNVVCDSVIEVMDSCDLGCGYVSFKEEVTGFCGFDCGFSKSYQENLEPGPSLHNVVLLDNVDLRCGYDSFKGLCGLNHGFLKSNQKKLDPGPSFVVQTETQAELHNGIHDDMTAMVNSCDLGYGCVSFNVEVTGYCGFDNGFSKFNQGKHDPRPSSDCMKKPVIDVQTENQAELHCTESKHQQNGSTVDCLKKPVLDCEIENPKYICKICSRSFKSGQSLGGHRLHCPKRSRSSISYSGACYETSIKTELLIHDLKSESSILELLGSENPIEKHRNGKRHKCLHCCKSFNSGQSLGGHMRAHLKRDQSNKLSEFQAEFREQVL